VDNGKLARLTCDSPKCRVEVGNGRRWCAPWPLASERPVLPCADKGERSMPRSEFAIQFEQAFDIHRAIHVVATRTAQCTASTDPAEVVRHVIAECPDLETRPIAELHAILLQAAADAGLSCWAQSTLRDPVFCMDAAMTLHQ